MLKVKKLKYSIIGGYIQNDIDKAIMTSLLEYVEVPTEDIENQLNSNSYDPRSDEAKIRNIANRIDYKIICVEKLQEVDNCSEEEYGVIYDDEIPATYSENVKIVTNQFVMNNL